MSEIIDKRPTSRLLVERLRPDKISKMCLLNRVRTQVSGLKDETTGALKMNVLFYSPAPGTGKTTLTRILANGCIQLSLNASSDRGIDVIREQIVPFIHSHSITENRPKVVVLEEMDGMTAQAFDSLRAIIEDSGDVRFIGNCNDITKIPQPICSRFACIPLDPMNTEERDELIGVYKMYIGMLLEKKGVSHNDDTLTRFIMNRFPSMRDIVNDVDLILNSGVTSLDNFSAPKEYSCSELFEFLFTGNPIPDVFKTDLYTKIVNEYSTNAADVINAFCDQFIDYVLDNHREYANFIDMFAIAFGEYADQLTRTTNPKVVLMALVFSIYQIIQGAGQPM